MNMSVSGESELLSSDVSAKNAIEKHIGKNHKKVDLTNWTTVNNTHLCAIANFCGKDLEELELTRFSKYLWKTIPQRTFDEEGIRELVEACPNLKHLGFSFCEHLTDTIVSDLSKCSKLSILNINFCHLITDQFLKALGDHCKELKRIYLVGCAGITKEGIGCLKKQIKGIYVHELIGQEM